MKILHTEASCGWGGQEIRILSEAQGLIERGHEVRLVCPPEACISREAARFGVPVDALPIGRKNLRGLLAMRSYLAGRHFDVINTHSSTDAWLTALACRTLPVAPPIVRTRHISAPIKPNFGTRWLYTKATDLIVTTGEALRQQLLDSLAIAPGNIFSVPTGVDIERYGVTSEDLRSQRRRELKLPEEVMLIGIVATLRSWKGHRFLIDAVADMPGVHLVIVGDGPQREALAAQVKAAGLEGRVWLVGSQPDVVPWLQSLDIFALPSYANEGVPQALMQAMACGLPCVTTNAGAISELARDEETALVVALKDTQALARALGRLAGDVSLRSTLGAAGRKHVLSSHSRTMMLDRMESLFARACNG